MQELFRLEGRVALVAGGTGGIGRVLAEGLSQHGAAVAIGGTTAAKAEAVAADLAAAGGQILGLAGDVTRQDAVDDLVRRTVAEFGRIDVLIDCVGGNARHNAEEFPEDEWDRLMDLNLKSAFLLSQRVAREFISQGPDVESGVSGRILHVSSVRSQLGIHDGYAAYCASKGGLNLLVKQLATEWARHGILVNAIAPTFIRTALVADMLNDKEFYEGLVRRIPLGRIGEPMDLVGPALLFVSPAANFVTGQVLFVDGGVTACQ